MVSTMTIMRMSVMMNIILMLPNTYSSSANAYPSSARRTCLSSLARDTYLDR